MPATSPDFGVVNLRPFVESDEDEVTSWFADAGELRFFAGRRLRWPLDAEQWRSIRDDETISAWSAVVGDDPTPAGHAELVTESSSTVRLARYAVAPNRRGLGLGRTILTQMFVMAREQGFGTLRLAVHPDNTTAIVTYRTFGFVTEPDPDHEFVDRITMSVSLG